MKRVRYINGRKDFRRILRPMDLQRMGIDHNHELCWETSNRFEIVLSNKVSDSLAARLPGEFILFEADGEDEAPAVEVLTNSVDDSAQVESESTPNKSVGDEKSPDESSTAKSSRNR